MTAKNAINREVMLESFMEISGIFSYGKNFRDIFTSLLGSVSAITGAEGGSLYIYDKNRETLKIVVMTNRPLGINKSVESFDALQITGIIEIPVMTDGKPQTANPSVCAFLEGRKILIASLEENSAFDFTRTRQFDRDNNYHTRNIICLPISGVGGERIGVFQLINCDAHVFEDDMQKFLSGLAGQAGIMLSNALLVNETKELMSAIIQMIGVAIDEKSPHTAGHCQRVVELTMMITDALINARAGRYKDFSLTDDQRRELRIAALLHDIGKIITPMHILDKQTKLHTLNDKINLLYERMRAWEMSNKLERLRQKLRKAGMESMFDEVCAAQTANEEDYDFLEKVNQGAIVVNDDVQQRLEAISERVIKPQGERDGKSSRGEQNSQGARDAQGGKTARHVIKREELNNLKVARGTLNPAERKIMEDHVSISIRLLSSIPWPSNLKKVVEYAGAHHENMNGTGYPNKLAGSQLALPARILGLADRFEGLSAPDRPYRSAKMTLSRVMGIMEDMAAKEEIDGELFEFFKAQKLHLKYARKHLPEELIDVT